MTKFYKLNTLNDFLFNEKPKSFLDPNYIYLKSNKISTTEIRKGNKVGNYFTSVSGKVVKFQNGFYIIENDFREDEISKPKQKIFKSMKKNLIINCIDDEPYTFLNEFLLNRYYDEVLSITDQFEFIDIVLKVNKYVDRTNLINKLQALPNANIHIFDDLYLIGKEQYIVKKLNLNKDLLTILTPKKILSILHEEKKGYELDTNNITIINTVTKKVSFLNIKNHISFEEVIKNKYIPYKKDYIYIANGLMKGKVINQNEVLDSSIDSISIVKSEKANKTKDCINCGACLKVCHLKLNPKISLKSKLKPKGCDECGMCTYICPSNINFKNIFLGDKDE